MTGYPVFCRSWFDALVRTVYRGTTIYKRTRPGTKNSRILLPCLRTVASASRSSVCTAALTCIYISRLDWPTKTVFSRLRMPVDWLCHPTQKVQPIAMFLETMWLPVCLGWNHCSITSHQRQEILKHWPLECWVIGGFHALGQAQNLHACGKVIRSPKPS